MYDLTKIGNNKTDDCEIGTAWTEAAAAISSLVPAGPSLAFSKIVNQKSRDAELSGGTPQRNLLLQDDKLPGKLPSKLA